MLWRLSCFCLYMCVLIFIKVRSHHHASSSITSPSFYLLQFLRQNTSLNMDLRPASSSFHFPSPGVTHTWLCIRLFMGFYWVKVGSYLKANTLQTEHFPIPYTDFVYKSHNRKSFYQAFSSMPMSLKMAQNFNIIMQFLRLKNSPVSQWKIWLPS